MSHAVPSYDPFQPVLQVVERYRSDVHRFGAASSSETLSTARDQLDGPLPVGLEAFLQRWDGAALFRGVLRIRSATDLAPACDTARGVILFADGPGANDRWAYTLDADLRPLFGRWHADEALFEPLHSSFDRWLHATVAILDRDVRDPTERLQTRLELDPGAASLHLALAHVARASGDHDAARARLERSTALDPRLAVAWAHLADLHTTSDPASARTALAQALRHLRLPRPFPARQPAAPPLLRALSALIDDDDGALTDALECFVDDGAEDVRRLAGSRLLERLTTTLAQRHLRDGDRSAAHATLSTLLERSADFTLRRLPAEALLQLIDLDIDSGEHERAETCLRRLRGRTDLVGCRALLAAARLATRRQEPWAEELLAEVLTRTATPMTRDLRVQARVRVRALTVAAERQRLEGDTAACAQSLGQARPVAERLGDPRLRAELALIAGDLQRALGSDPRAEYAAARAHAEAAGDTESLLRLDIREGERLQTEGETTAARRMFLRAAGGFREAGLALREAWAHHRLARMGDPKAAERARTMFKAADLAAGVAATDVACGVPLASLDWHLKRTADHARERTNARRGRPPLVRADADLPERRIGAHRRAIAACEPRIVAGLATKLDSAAQTLDAALSRVTDPTLVRYMAASDLVSAHRSYDAAGVMLRHLLVIRPSGLASAALIGALVRSPNMALVHGLIESLERADLHPRGVAAAAEVLGWRREASAVPVLMKLVSGSSPVTVRRAAILALGRIGDPVAVDVLVDALDRERESHDAAIALLLLGEWVGLSAQAERLSRDRTESGRAAGELIGRYGGPSHLLMLYRASERTDDVGLGALQGLGFLGDPRVVPWLIDAMGGRDLRRTQVANVALELLTNHHEPPEEPLLRVRWKEWWQANAGNFRSGLRYRHGRLYDPGLLIGRLIHDDPLVRRSTYDELVIGAGARLAFDAEGPYRVQMAHVRAWREWWTQSRGRFPQGRWTFHGEEIG